MRGSVEPVAVARDVASSSPSKPASALDMMRYQRPSTDCLPLPNGIGGSSGGGSKKTPAPRSSKGDAAAAPAVATDNSRLAAYLASTSLEPKPRARAPQPPAPAAAPQATSAAGAAAAAARSPARDHGAHHPPDFSDPTSPSSAVGGGEVLLQWGQNKRSRGRRDAASSASPQRRQPGAKIQRGSPAPADKLMPPPSAPPSYTRGSNLRVGSSLQPRAGAGDAHHSRGALPHPHRSAEERAGGKSSSSSAAARAEKQRPSDKAAPQHKPVPVAVMGLSAPEPKQRQQHHHHHQEVGGSSSHQAEQQPQAASSSKPAAKLEMPRIYTSLSRKEKEEDFMAMKGTKLPVRPKKRPKAVEKALTYIYPGTWLTDATRSRYEVREKKCPKKQQKHRGLKGMESMDSDSD